PGAFLNLMAITLLFLTDLHYVVLNFFIKAYDYLSPSHHPFASWGEKSSFLADYTFLFLDTLSKAFALGLALAGPVIIISALAYIIAGILNRLIPQMQVFFIVQPLQLFLGFG